MPNAVRFLLVASLFLLGWSFWGMLALGPTPSDSLAMGWFFSDRGQSIFHAVLGLICLAGYFWTKSDKGQRILSGFVGVVALVLTVMGIINFTFPQPNIGIFNIETVELVLYTFLALTGFWVAFMPEGPVFIKETKVSDIVGETTT